ncbi:phage holin, lambda family [Pasteurella testudinis DSM 23072]|uniref:Phage holin, lambda family n=1 Tax=Pasteurella testudinis DSM 23072 TaxID=1122938 RepID=A0A1W1V424_9PAST|nr:phage holin, lambda family [Pasteurella testudinis]SMB88036.1 phage holin, lambda family [Pasteurella testudinis DSM 23072]SUB51618.1 phage holin, lambda family [Pasteurella testudinis]
MPEKNPDVWAAIWTWLSINFSGGHFNGAIAAILMTILRVLFQRKKNKFRYILIDGLICAGFVQTSIPLLERGFGHSDYATFLGVFLGFVGTEKLREFLFAFVNEKIKKQSYPDFDRYRTQRDDSYGESAPDERD